MLLVIGAALTWLPLALSGIPFSVAVVWMGCALLSKKDVSIGHREGVIVAKSTENARRRSSSDRGKAGRPTR
jgi:hypothetical protein